MLEAHFVFEIFSWLWIWLISKFPTSQTGQHIITIHILPNFSRSKGNETVKFGQLTEYDLRSIFL